MRRAVLLVLLLLPLSPGAALTVAPDEVSSSDGTVLVRWTGDAGALHLTGDSIGGVLSDTVKTDRPSVFGAPLENATGTRDLRQESLPPGADRVDVLSSGDPTFIVQPLSPDFGARLVGPGDVVLDAVDDEVLESNHAYEDPDPEEDFRDNYVFRAKDVVAARAHEATIVLVEGDFLLYVWDATLTQDGPGGARSHDTGTWREPGSAPGLWDIHYRHALLLVRNGSLFVDAPEGATLYSAAVHLADAGSGLFDEGSDEPIIVTRDGAGIGLERVPVVLAPPGAAVPWWPWPVAALLLLLFLVPNAVGAGDVGPGPFAQRFCAARADGYRRLAVRAEARRRYRLAAYWMGRAARWDHDAELVMQHAIYLRLAGHHGRALGRHRDAEHAFRSEGVVHALNAYEAARAAASVGLVQEALQWLLSAVRAEPWLGRQASFEPDLAPLRSLPAFMDVARAADDDGLLRP